MVGFNQLAGSLYLITHFDARDLDEYARKVDYTVHGTGSRDNKAQRQSTVTGAEHKVTRFVRT